MHLRKQNKWSCNLRNKAFLRKHLLQQRALISIEERQLAALAACDIFTQSQLFLNSQHIAGYFAQPAEFDCIPLLQHSWQSKKNCFLPAISQENGNTLIFLAYESQDPLKLNCYKIPEPTSNKKISLPDLDIIILPLVGFDIRGNRLGMGGGYYDRTLAPLKNITKKPYLLGLGFECQKTALLPHDSWDIPLDGVLTEKKFYPFK